MSYKVETTNQGRFALLKPNGETLYLYHSEFAAQTACDAMNRAAYEPVIDPYWQLNAGPCEVPVRRGRWDSRRVA
jgi:hypothetical protein